MKHLILPSTLWLLVLALGCGRDVTYATISDRSPAAGGDRVQAPGTVGDDGTEGSEGIESIDDDDSDDGTAEATPGVDGAASASPAGVDGASTGARDFDAPGLLPEPPTRHADAGAPAVGGDAKGSGPSHDALPSCWLGDGPATAAAEPQPIAGELRCPLLAEWSAVVVSGPAGCEAFSSAREARWFEWRGGALAGFDPAATPFASAGSQLERMRRCRREVEGGGFELWRFEESFELGGPLPSGQCPTEAFGARYRYTEHGKLPGPGIVFGADQPEACEYEACVRFTPSPAGLASAPASSEALCAPPSSPDEPSHAAAIGERCRLSYECEAGSFCSLERDDGSCAFPGEEVCQRAPRLDECSSEPELVCPCYRAPVTDSNRCEQNAGGVSVGSCP